MPKRKVSSKATAKVVKKAKKASPILTTDSVKNTVEEIVNSPVHYNEIGKLIRALSKSSDQELSSAVLEGLTKVFAHLLKSGQLRLSRKMDEKRATVAKWLRSQYDSYREAVYGLWNLGENELDLQIEGLHSLMQLLRLESDTMGPSTDQPYFATMTYQSILDHLLVTGQQDEILEDQTIDNPLVLEFYEQYFNKYWDIKYFLFEDAPSVVEETATRSKEEQSLLFSNVLTLVKPAPMYPKEDVEDYMLETLVAHAPNKVEKLSTFRANFEKTWLALMSKLDLSSDQAKAVLVVLHKRIIPFFNNPVRLMDFLTDAYNMGFDKKDVALSILALNGLWELMRTHNLEYPDFYEKLYAILTPELLHLNYRSRFFRLLDLFMSSTHLSATVVASFLKRLARLTLTAPPAGVIAVIPFTYNLLKLHPACMKLIHCPDAPEDYQDPFNEEEKDPSKTNALDSSLWELETAMNHYHPQVASLAKIMKQPFSKNSYNMEDFLDWSYDKLIENELHKKYKGELSQEFEKWDSLFGENGFMEGYSM